MWGRSTNLCSPRREVWPEGDVFGPPGVEPPEETQLLREICFAELPRECTAPPHGSGVWGCSGPLTLPPTGPTAPPEAEEPEEPEEEEEEEEEEEAVRVSEKEFNFMDYLKR